MTRNLATDPQHCRHEVCGCAVPRGRRYCSPYCANAQEQESLPGEADLPGSCACSHAGCGEHEPRRSTCETVTSTGRP